MLSSFPIADAGSGPAKREGVKAEFLEPRANLLRNEPGPHEKWPKVPRIVIHLMVVHLGGWAQSQAKGGEFQEPLSAPGWNVDEQTATRHERPMGLAQGREWLP